MLNIYKNRSNHQYKTASIIREYEEVRVIDQDEEIIVLITEKMKEAADLLGVKESEIRKAAEDNLLIDGKYSIKITDGRLLYPFRFKKMTQEDITKVQYLSGLRTSTEEFILSTTTQFEFDVLEHQVNIDGIKFKILDAFKEDNLHGEGMFRREHIKTTYLRIGK